MEILAKNLRPEKIEDIIGQEHLVSKGKVIYNMLLNKKVFSMILYGRPGIGKTSLANVIAKTLDKPYIMLNATVNNKEDFINAINEAKINGDLILIIDEIHRMNKDKQDILLPYIEDGTIILIGLTTSNPYMKVNPAIRSRVSIFELHDLSIEDITKGLNKALKSLDNIKIDDETIKYIATLSCGDFRYALNLLEVAYNLSNNFEVTIDTLKEINAKPNIYMDSGEDAHYDLLSALQKSIRGSDPNASIYYLARLLEGEDLDSIERRLSVIAYEDISLANPGIGPRVDAAINAAERVGLPEARIPLASIVIEMALSPKSNSTYMALAKATNDIKLGKSGKIPKHIKTNSKEYKYPHNYEKSYVKQTYLPEELKDSIYYIPKNNNIENNLNKVYEDMKKDS